MSVRGILHQLTREKPLPNCCRECESKYDKAEDAIRKEIAREIRDLIQPKKETMVADKQNDRIREIIKAVIKSTPIVKALGKEK
jgi:hypothetical protein